MIPWYWVIIALFVGVIFGIILIAVCASGEDE